MTQSEHTTTTTAPDFSALSPLQGAYAETLAKFNELQARIDEAREKVEALSAALADAEAEKGALLKQKATIGPTPENKTALVKVRERLQDTADDLEVAAITLENLGPQELEAARQLAMARSNLNEAFRRALLAGLPQARARLAELLTPHLSVILGIYNALYSYSGRGPKDELSGLPGILDIKPTPPQFALPQLPRRANDILREAQKADQAALEAQRAAGRQAAKSDWGCTIHHPTEEQLREYEAKRAAQQAADMASLHRNIDYFGMTMRRTGA